MRILDKNTDFYDYLQGIYRDDSITFDRTDSFIVTKEIMCDHLNGSRYWRGDRNDRLRFALLQVCNTFWIFAFKITEFDNYDKPKNYEVSLVHTWKNYNKPRCLIKLDVITFPWTIWYYIDKKKPVSDEFHPSEDNIHRIVESVEQNNYEVKSSVNRHIIYSGATSRYNRDIRKVEKHIPLLIACGIGNCIDPLDMYLSIEEYFSLEKQSIERIESLGLTDTEKVENHGFDKKTSFRGKLQ